MYKRLVNFGMDKGATYNNDPLTYCLGNNISQRFNHGGNSDTYGQNSKPCQVYMARRCADQWDNICDHAMNPKTNDEFAFATELMDAGMNQIQGLTSGEVFLRNVAIEKYRTSMNNCDLRRESFDPLSPSSPNITYFVGQNCIPTFSVDPYTIDDDPVMNRILLNPRIASDILFNIYTTMNKAGTLHQLIGTRLGNSFNLT